MYRPNAAGEDVATGNLIGHFIHALCPCLPCGNAYLVGDSDPLSPIPFPLPGRCGTCSCTCTANSMMACPGLGGSSSRFIGPDYRHQPGGSPVARAGRPAGIRWLTARGGVRSCAQPLIHYIIAIPPEFSQSYQEDSADVSQWHPFPRPTVPYRLSFNSG